MYERNATSPSLLAGNKCQDQAAKAKSEGITIKIPETSLSFELIQVPRGKLKEQELRGFWMGKHEVTWGLFTPFLDEKPDKKLKTYSHPAKGWSSIWLYDVPEEQKLPHLPMPNLRWHGAVAYCSWLSERTGDWYRLPTEPEWELAARAGAGGPAPKNLGQVAWFKENSGDRAHRGGEKPTNDFGLCDMLGNMWEYCQESRIAPFHDPVLRGGAWNTPADRVTFTHRQSVIRKWFEPDPNRPRSVWWLQAGRNQGFRVVRVASKESLRERTAYSTQMEVKVESGNERAARSGKVVTYFNHVTGTVRNPGQRTLDEVELLVYSLNEDGTPHMTDLNGLDHPGRPTWSKVYPVLVNSNYDDRTRMPLRPGESRRWSVDVPFSFDEPPDLAPGKFGARVTNVRFSKR